MPLRLASPGAGRFSGIRMTAHTEFARERFTDSEWALLTDAPLLTGMMVLAAGRRGSVRGTFEVIGEYAAVRERGAGALVPAILVGPAPNIRARVRRRRQLAGAAAPALREAMDILARKASDGEREDYVRFVLDVARAAARVGGEQRQRTLGGVIAIVSGDAEVPIEPTRPSAISRLQARTAGYVARHPTMLKVLEWLGWNNPGGSMNP
jgi:hypothetical protein